MRDDEAFQRPTDASGASRPAADADPGAPVQPGRALPAEPTATRLRREYPAWDRILHDFFRPGWGQVAMAVVLCLVSCAVVVQVRHKPDDSYSTMRRTDLVQLLDQLNAEQSRLDTEVNRLQSTRQQLASGADAQRVAQQEASKRLDALGILAGTLPAAGPGIRLTITDPQHRVTAAIMLDAVEEMRDAGAEAMQLNGKVRIVAQTAFSDKDGMLVADGVELSPPYVLDVIGESRALDEGARFRGGLVSQVESSDVGGRATVQRLDTVEVTALHTPLSPQWAHPA